MIVPDPNMFGGSVLISKKLGSSWKNFKTNKMTLEKSILDHKVQELTSHVLMQIIEAWVCLK